MKLSKNACCIHYLWKQVYILKVRYPRETFFKTSEFFMQASLVEVSIYAKFQIKIRKYVFSENMESHRGLLKIDILKIR
jgi:hypothetical protein